MEAENGLELAQNIGRQLSHGWYGEQLVEFYFESSHCCLSVKDIKGRGRWQETEVTLSAWFVETRSLTRWHSRAACRPDCLTLKLGLCKLVIFGPRLVCRSFQTCFEHISNIFYNFFNFFKDILRITFLNFLYLF